MVVKFDKIIKCSLVLGTYNNVGIVRTWGKEAQGLNSTKARHMQFQKHRLTKAFIYWHRIYKYI